MARSFDGNDNINFGTGADVDLGAVAQSATAWVKFPSNFTAERMILAKTTAGFLFKQYLVSFGTTQNDLAFVLDRVTADCVVVSVTNTLTAGVWNFVAATWSGLDANLPKLYAATLGNLAAEVSYSATRQTGSGSFTDTTTASLRIGSRDPLDAYWVGEIADVKLFNSALTLAQIIAVQFDDNPPAAVFNAPLWGIENPEIDLVAGKRGTVTGATKAQHAPLIGYPSGTRPGTRPRPFAPGLAR